MWVLESWITSFDRPVLDIRSLYGDRYPLLLLQLLRLKGNLGLYLALFSDHHHLLLYLPSDNMLVGLACHASLHGCWVLPLVVRSPTCVRCQKYRIRGAGVGAHPSAVQINQT